MNKKIFFSLALIFFTLLPLCAKPSEKEIANSTTFGVIFDYGFSAAQVTRIEILNNRSNFVRENYMVGMYGAARTVNLPLINFIGQACVYYPLYQTFNGMQQDAKQTLLYAGDVFLSPIYEFNYFRYVKFDAALGAHFMYQLTDEWHMFYLGAGLRLGITTPIFQQWDLVSDVLLTIDSANLGQNHIVQPFDVSYQYHVNIGFRYTTKKLNSNYCFNFFEKMFQKK